MDKPTQEQIKEFWEWCEFKQSLEGTKPYKDYDRYEYSFNELPPVDLNNLFKYAVPKVIKKLGKFKAYMLIKKALRDSIMNGNPFEDTLFWAIWEVIKI